MNKDNRNNEQIYGRNDMIMLDQNNKIYGSLGIADRYVMKTEEGTRLILSNPKQGRFGDVLTEFNIYGRSEQKQYSGKNLLKIRDGVQTERGVTVIAKDGVVALKGTATETGWTTLKTDSFILNGMYILSSNLTDVTIRLANKSYKAVISQNESKTLENEEVSVLCFVVKEGITYDVSNILVQIEKGSKATSYEPYVGGQPSPSPEYPQEIKSVGDNGSVVVNVTGANVLEGTKLGVKSTVNGITYTTYENGILITGTATKDFFIVLHNDIIHPLTRGAYYLTTSGLNSSVSLNFYYVGKFVDDSQNIKVTLGKDVEYSLRLQIQKGTTLNTTVQVSLTKSKITSYEPYYEEQTATLPYILNAIPVSSGGNVIIDGQQYIADYVDVERGKLVRLCYLYKFDMADYVGVLPDETIQDIRFVFTLRNASKEQYTRIGLSNIGYKHYQDIDNSVYPYGVCIGSANEARIRLKGITNKTELAEYLMNNNVFLLYSLQTPIEEELTTEQIQTLKEFVTYYPVTIIENNYNTWMKATYKSTESV